MEMMPREPHRFAPSVIMLMSFHRREQGKQVVQAGLALCVSRVAPCGRWRPDRGGCPGGFCHILPHVGAEELQAGAGRWRLHWQVGGPNMMLQQDTWEEDHLGGKLMDPKSFRTSLTHNLKLKKDILEKRDPQGEGSKNRLEGATSLAPPCWSRASTSMYSAARARLPKRSARTRRSTSASTNGALLCRLLEASHSLSGSGRASRQPNHGFPFSSLVLGDGPS